MPVVTRELEYARLAFAHEAIERFRAAYPNTRFAEWIEDQAERMSRFGRRRSYIDVDDHYFLRAFNVLKTKRVPREKAHGSWSASIHLSDRGHTVSVLATSKTDVRALAAHELGHALLYSHSELLSALSRPGALVDATIERVADDLARALLLPGSLLDDYLQPADDGKNAWTHIEQISRNAFLQPRLVASRLAYKLVDDEAAVVCCSIPVQGDLFDRDSRDAMTHVSVRWIMLYKWLNHPSPREYLFCDRVEKRASLKREAHFLLKLSPGEQVEPNALRLLVGDTNWQRVSRFTKICQIARIPEDNNLVFIFACSL